MEVQFVICYIRSVTLIYLIAYLQNKSLYFILYTQA